MLTDDRKKNSFLVFSYGVTSWSVEGDHRYLEPFNQEVLNNNFVTIFELSISEKIMELNDEILRFNSSYEYLFKNLNTKKKLLKDFEQNEQVDVLRELSFIIYKLALRNEKKIQANIYNLNVLKELITFPKIKNEIEEIIEIEFCNEDKEGKNIRKVAKLIIDLSSMIWIKEQQEMRDNEEKIQKLLNFRAKDDDLYRLDIYKISEKIEELKKSLEEELEKLKK